MNEVRTMRSRDLIRVCLRRDPKPRTAAAPSTPAAARPPIRPATGWPMTRTASLDAAGCADHTTVVTVGDDSPPEVEEGDSDPPSPCRARAPRHGMLVAALLLGGALVMGLSASPAGAQEGGDGGGMSSSDGGMSSGMSSSDGGMSSMSSTDSGMSSSFSSSDSSMSSGCCGSDSSMSSTFSGSDTSMSSTFSGSDSSMSSTFTGSGTSMSSGLGTDSSLSSTDSSFSTDTSYAGSATGTTGFEGSPETGPAHAAAVGTESSTYSAPADTGVASDTGALGGTTRGTSVSDTSSEASTYSADTTSYSGSETGTTGFEGSSEVGPAHAAAVDAEAEAAGSISDTTLTGFEGSSEVGPAHAEAVSTNADTWSAPTEATPYSGEITGFEGSPEMGPDHGVTVNAAPTSWTGDTTPTGFEGSPEVGPAHAEAVNAEAPSWTGDVTPTGFEGSPEVGPEHAAAIDAEAEAATDQGYRTGFEGSPELGPRLAQDMLDAENFGRLDAEAARQAMTELGLDPSRFDPTQLRNLMSPSDPAYGQLVDAINTLANDIRSPLRGDDRFAGPYATRAFETLDVEGTRALMGAINQMAYNRAWSLGPSTPDVRSTMADPMAQGFAYATESPVAPLSVFEGLRNLESRWQQHQLGQLINGGFGYDPVTGETTRDPSVSYDPTQLAQFANAITEFGRTHQLGIQPNDSTITDPAFSGLYGLDVFNPVVNPASLMYQGPEAWNGDVTMQVPEALALRALSVDPEASFQFTGLSPENLATVVRPSQDIIGYWGYANDDVSRLRGLMDQYGADVMRGALTDAVANELSRYPAALDRYADVTRLMAQDVRTSDPVRQAYADVLGAYFTTPEGQLVGSYINDIGEAAVRQRETRYATEAERMAQDFNRVDLMGAFREVAMSEDAARTIGQVMNAWTAMRAAGFLDDANLQQGEVNTALRPNALVLDTIRQGFEDIGVPTVSQKALADSIKYWGSIVAAGAGPVANAFGGAGLAVPAAGAGLFGSLTWAGSTYAAAQAEKVSPPPFHGDDLARSLALNLRQDLANAVAQRQGEAPPAPGQIQSTLDRAFPEVGDPMDAFIDLSANEGYLNARRGTHWSH